MPDDFTSQIGDFDSVENLARSRFGMDKSSEAASKAIGESVDIVGAQDTAARTELQKQQARLKELEKQEEDLADPGKYQKVRNAQTGGFDFFDPLGEKITVSEYAEVTQKRRDEILKDSLDIKDMQFLQEHFDLEDYMNIKIRSKSGQIAPEDQEFIDKVEQNNPELQSIPLNDIISKFRSRYSRYYETSGRGDEDVSRFFVDQEQEEPEDSRSNVQRVKDLINPFQ